MSPRSSNRPKAAPPASADIYVGLLVVSVAALATGCIFLVLELNRYGWQMPQ